MAFTSSLMTLQDLKTAVEDVLNKSINDYTLTKAVNNCLNIYQALEKRYTPQRYRKTAGPVTIDSSGYDLSGISDLWSDWEGFVVYRDSRFRMMLPPVTRGEGKRGYFIEGDGKIYPNPTTTSYTAYIKYMLKPTRFDLTGTIDLTQKLPIAMEMEEAFENYVMERYFRKKGQPAMGQDLESQFRAKLKVFFNDGASRVHTL